MRRKSTLARKTRLRASSARRRGMADRSREWSLNVRGRDLRCQICRAAGGLEAHHVYPKGTYPDLRFVLDNGLALCPPCHREWHSASTSHRCWWEKWWPERHAVIRGLISARRVPGTD